MVGFGLLTAEDGGGFNITPIKTTPFPASS